METQNRIPIQLILHMNKTNSQLLKCIHKFLCSRTNPDGSMPRQKLLSILGASYHIPKEDRTKVIGELHEKGIIKELGKFSFTINRVGLSKVSAFPSN